MSHVPTTLDFLSRNEPLLYSTATELKALHAKESQKPPCPPPDVFSTSRVHNKENDSGLSDVLEDSGYLSQQTSQIQPENEDPVPAKPSLSRHSSPSKCPPAASTPVGTRRRTMVLSSTPSDQRGDPNLPILRFQKAVCEELAKSYQKNKRYDFSVIGKLAEDHLLDRVIGGHMGTEYVDVFSGLLLRNMRCILSSILLQMGDLDLISCKKVSRTWRKIVTEDPSAQRRCQRAEQTVRESTSSLRSRPCDLTRDPASRVVLSCLQTLATPTSSSSSSSSSPSSRLSALQQKGCKSRPQSSRYDDFIKAVFPPGGQHPEAARVSPEVPTLRFSSQALVRGPAGHLHALQLPLRLLHRLPRRLPRLRPLQDPARRQRQRHHRTGQRALPQEHPPPVTDARRLFFGFIYLSARSTCYDTDGTIRTPKNEKRTLEM